MPILKIGDEYADADYELLVRHLELLDRELAEINSAIASSRDPESCGLFDAGEYFIGHGFVAIQRYLTATRTGLGVRLSDALRVPPMLHGGLSLAAALNAGANYWKHVDEWIEELNKSENADLKGKALKTLEHLETVTPWDDYTCANLLSVLMEGHALELSRLLPAIAEWRHNLFRGLLAETEG